MGKLLERAYPGQGGWWGGEGYGQAEEDNLSRLREENSRMTGIKGVQRSGGLPQAEGAARQGGGKEVAGNKCEGLEDPVAAGVTLGDLPESRDRRPALPSPVRCPPRCSAP